MAVVVKYIKCSFWPWEGQAPVWYIEKTVMAEGRASSA